MTPIDEFRLLKKRFDAAHVEMLSALKAGDWEGVQSALRVERQIVNEQSLLIDKHRRFVKQLRL